MSRNEVVVFDSIRKSNLPSEEKSALQRWAESMVGPIAKTRPRDAAGGFLSAFRQGSEGVATAAALAYLHVNNESGLDVAGVPIDGVGGGALLAASALMGHSELGTDARNIGNDGLTIWSFRMMTNFFAERRKAAGKALPSHLIPGARPSGVKNDPIIAAATNL